MADIQAFKDELKALLKKHDVSIDFMASDCSDWYGMSDTRMSVVDRSGHEARLADGESISAGDL